MAVKYGLHEKTRTNYAYIIKRSVSPFKPLNNILKNPSHLLFGLQVVQLTLKAFL